MTTREGSRILHAVIAGLGVCAVANLAIGGLAHLLYASLGQPSWFGRLAVIVEPVVLVLGFSVARDTYRDTATQTLIAAQHWGRRDTIGLAVLTGLVGFAAAVWIVSGSLPAGLFSALLLAVFAGVVGLIITGLRLTRAGR